jgi:hypothetical protein
VPRGQSGDGDDRQRLLVSTPEQGQSLALPVFDLDVRSEDELHQLSLRGQVQHGWRRVGAARISALLAFVLLVGGAVVAGSVTHWWDLRQQRLAQEAVVSLVALVPASSVERGGGDGRRAEIEARLALANSGPLPVEVSDLRATQDGFALRMEGTSRLVRPGVSSVIVQVTLDCMAGMPREPVRVLMSVRTMDGKLHQASSLMVVVSTPWSENFDWTCEPPSR